MSRDEDCEHRCGGHCCKAFYLPFSPDELQRRAAELRDGAIIAGMVEHLGFFDDDNRPIDLTVPVPRSGGHFYSCRHLTSTGLCGIYDTRPQMCKGYPYKGACNYRGCQAACRATTDTPEDDLRC